MTYGEIIIAHFVPGTLQSTWGISTLALDNGPVAWVHHPHFTEEELRLGGF